MYLNLYFHIQIFFPTYSDVNWILWMGFHFKQFSIEDLMKSGLYEYIVIREAFKNISSPQETLGKTEKC